MCTATSQKKETGRRADSSQKLMVSAFVCLENSCALSTEVRRGMPILSQEGDETGKVAAVILDQESCKATHILLSRLPETRGYWMVPVEAVAQVQAGRIQLDIPKNAVDALPLWHPGE